MSIPKLVPATSALELIGDTPLVELSHVRDGPGRVLAKGEFLQPGGSVKDRAAKAIIMAARADGRLRPNRPIVEMTSGNMGAGLAVIAAVLEHPLLLTISSGNSPQRVRMLEALGAEVVVVPQVDGSPGNVTGADIAAAQHIAREIAEARGGFYVDQFNAIEAVREHEEGTGRELWLQTGGSVDAWVAAVGTGATFCGVAAYLKRQNPDIVCAAAEPEGCRVLAGESVSKPRHLLQGTSYGAVPPHWRPDLMDLSIPVSDDETIRWREILARREGLYVGYSAAANVCAAVKLLRSGRVPGASPTVATVLCDSGLKY